MTGEFQRWATALLDQQLWCWGRDIARSEGNVLLGVGFHRHRPPDTRYGSSTLYRARLDSGAEAWLWGFGLLYRDPALGCVFLRRYGFNPALLDRPPELVHRAEHLGPLIRPTTATRLAACALIRGVAEWVAGCEHRVAESYGIKFRAAALVARSTPPVVPARGMAAGWGRLAQKAFRIDRGGVATGPWGALLSRLRVFGPNGRTRFCPPGQRQLQSPKRSGRGATWRHL